MSSKAKWEQIFFYLWVSTKWFKYDFGITLLFDRCFWTIYRHNWTFPYPFRTKEQVYQVFGKVSLNRSIRFSLQSCPLWLDFPIEILQIDLVWSYWKHILHRQLRFQASQQHQIQRDLINWIKKVRNYLLSSSIIQNSGRYWVEIHLTKSFFLLIWVILKAKLPRKFLHIVVFGYDKSLENMTFSSFPLNQKKIKWLSNSNENLEVNLKSSKLCLLCRQVIKHF